MKNIGFAIVGLGSIADFHAEAIRQAEGAELRACFSRNAEKTAKFAEKNHAEAASSLEELLARPDVDVVCIATPSGSHAEPAIAALEAGKHILCEKPLDVTLERAQKIIDTAAAKGLLAAAVFQSRFGPGAQAVRKAVLAGRFGKITNASAYIKWWRDADYYQSNPWRGTRKFDGGGALMNQGIHAIDLLQWLVGMPKEVFAYADALAHEGLEVEDTAVAALRFPNGALGVIEGATSCYPGVAKRIEIAGTDGFVILEDDRLVKWEFRNALPEDEALRDSQKPSIGGGASDPRAISVDGHRAHVEDLVRVIRDGGTPAVDARDAVHAIRLILGIYESAQTHQPVRLDG